MEENKITLLDENGNEVQARIINIIEIEGQEYLLYSTEANEEEENLYINKIIKGENGEENFVPIENEEEKNKVFNLVKGMINDLD